jgi:hypothetical protein
VWTLKKGLSPFFDSFNSEHWWFVVRGRSRAAWDLVCGLLDVGRWAVRAALGDHITGAAFATAALGSDTEFELDLVEAHACAGVADDVTVRDAAADTDDHGGG